MAKVLGNLEINNGNLDVGKNVSTAASWIQVGAGRTGSGYSYIDLVGDTTYTDYGLRIIRYNTGANTESEIVHRGTNNLKIGSYDAANVIFKTANTERVRITSDGNLGVNTSNPLKSIQVGDGTTSEVVRVYYSDSSYIDITGFGLEMARAASYIRPNTDKNRSLYIGNDGKTWDTIHHNASVTTFVTDTTEHMRINSSGNVGIGTATPAGKLSVVDNTNTLQFAEHGSSDIAELKIIADAAHDAAIYFGDTVDNVRGGIYYDTSLNNMQFRGYNNATRMIIDSNGNVGIGTGTPSGKLHIQTDASSEFIFTGASTSGYATTFHMDNIGLDIGHNSTGRSLNLKTGSLDRLTITGAGNVGIGTTSPDEKLHIAGDLKVDSDLPRIYLTDSSHNPDYSIVNNNGNFAVFDDTNSAYRIYVNSTGNVGIGTSLPAALLDVNGTAQMSTGITENVHYVGSSIQHWGDAGTGLYFETDELRFYTGNAEEMRLENDGDLHVDGDVIAYSTTVSDERLKDDIQTIDNACEKVCSLRGVEYTWNNGSRKGQREIGVIAQEVEKVIPEIVREKKLSLVDDEVYKTVDYEKLVAVLIEANKELCDRVSKLESKLDGITD